MKNLLLFFFFCLFGLSCIQKIHAQDGQKEPLKTILLRSTGEVAVAPDMASFYVNLSCLDKDIEKSHSCLIRKSNELLKQLKGFGLDEKDIQTTAIQLTKQYKWQDKQQLFEGYKSSLRHTIVVRDIDKLSEIYSGLLTNENLEINGLNYSHSEMDRLQNEAYVEALRNAKMRCKKLLEELPEQEMEILRISNVQLQAGSRQQEMNLYKREDASASSGTVAISAGMITVSAVLFIEFAVE